MMSFINRIDRLLKTKEDLQTFVMIAFVLFIVVVKCYTMIVNPNVGNAANAKRNAEVVKIHADSNS